MPNCAPDRPRVSRLGDTRDPSHGRILPFAVGATGTTLLLFAYYAVRWRSFAGFSKVIDSCAELFCDFIIYYYPMGEAIFRTGVPVPGFLYSPFIAVLLAVFPPLGLTASLVLWGILQVLFVVFYLLLFRRLVPAGPGIQAVFVALALTSYPLLLNQLAGQVSVFMIVALLGLLALNGHGDRAAGAGLLAFAVSFKFYPILFLAPFVARRDARFLLLATAWCGALLVVIPGALLGASDALRFYAALLESFRDSGWVTANPHSQYFPHLVLRLVGAGNDVSAHLPLLHGLALGVAAANMGLVFLVQRARLRLADLWSFQIVFLTIPFVLKTSWPHDFVFLPFTQALLAWRLWGGERAAPGSRVAGESPQASVGASGRTAATLLLLVPSMVLSNVVFFNLFGDFTLYGFLGFLFWANLLLLAASYVQLLPPALRRTQ